MNFEEWLKNNPNTDKLTWEEDLQKAWNAAIDEAVKAAKEGHSYTPTSTAHNIAKRIKELKE